MRRSRRWTRRRVPVGAAGEDRSVYVGAPAERRRSRASPATGSAYVTATERGRVVARRFYVELGCVLRRSYDGRHGARRARSAHAEEGYLQRAARSDPFAPRRLEHSTGATNAHLSL